MILLPAVAALASCAGGDAGKTSADSSSADGTSDRASAEAAPGVIELAGADGQDYVIVRADQAASWETDGAVALNRGISELFGTRLNIITDYDGKGGRPRVPREILVGMTNRSDEAVYPDRSGYGWGGYSITVSGEWIVIDASGGEGMRLAVERFLSLLSVTEKDGKKILTAGTDLHVIENRKVSKENLFDIGDRSGLVAICYSTWFDPIIEQSGGNPANVAEVLEGKRDWGGVNEFHYWSKPALGYYRSTDREVIRTHMTMLAEAGIDFIIVDNTNASVGWADRLYYDAIDGVNRVYWDSMVKNPGITLMETIYEMRREGLETPYVAMWCGTEKDYGTIDKIYGELYADGKYDDLWVWWDGKPLFLCTKLHGDREDLTLRMMWGLKSQGVSEWSFLNYPNKVAYDAEGNAEQVCVCTAVQRTYMSFDAVGRRGGLTFYEQWQTAFAARPKVVTLTWWNEWAAQRFIVNGESAFVDNYSPEFSRDIEPMEGGHGDLYYRWMKEYIRAYRSGEECPRLVE
ncbi:MAG: hypothetical protein ILO42_08940 [Clostridia bacterium]|nr:hypothetical protein [Clostridia bacterium]